MRIKPNKLEELSREVNKKARELQGVQEEVDALKGQVRELGERKTKLNRELADIERVIVEKQEHLDLIVDRGMRFLANVKVEADKEVEKLNSLRYQVADMEEHLKEISVPVREADDFLRKAGDARLVFLEQKAQLDAAESALRVNLARSMELEAKDATRQKEMDAFKQYLTDFYGKVATYTKAAEETIAYINDQVERHVPLRFKLPKVPVTMDNFNRL